MRCWRPVSTSFSSSRCAVSSTSAAGASKATRPLVPMMVSPRWMPRPMPNGAASASSVSMSGHRRRARGHRAPPGARPRRTSTCRSGARGSRNASRVSTQASSGMLPAEVSVSLPPIVTPHRPRLIEYAAPKGGIGQLALAADTRARPARRRPGRAPARGPPGRAPACAARPRSAPGRCRPRCSRARSVRAEPARHARDGLRLHDALGADAERVELAAPHVAHDEEAQHLLEVIGARVDLVMLDGARAHAPARPACGPRPHRCRRCRR